MIVGGRLWLIHIGICERTTEINNVVSLVTATPCVSPLRRPPECGARAVTGIYRPHRDPVSAVVHRWKQRPERTCSRHCLVAAVLKARPH